MKKFRKYRNNQKWLIQKYLKEKLNTYEIANLINCEHKTICKWLEAFNISRRTRSEAAMLAIESLTPDERKKYFTRNITHLHGENNPAKRPEVREKISKTMKGILRTPEAKKRMSKANSGINNPRWRGGLSFEPYSLEFNDKLKAFIRKRDNYCCQECGIKENGNAHDCHHLDYDKKNNEPENLITLCKSCHSKTNGNREYWQNHFMSQEGVSRGFFF